MTDFEMQLVIAELHTLAQNSVLSYFTIISGYLAAAYVIGPKLSRTQSIFLSFLFVLFSAFSIWG